jgi:hypothetical protein
MSEQLDRRNAVKAVAVAGGLLLLGGSVSADQREEPITLTGEWLNGGKADQPCAIIQLGRVLLLINEKGTIATGQITDINQLTVLKGWDDELPGKVIARGKVILWKGGGRWRRR